MLQEHKVLPYCVILHSLAYRYLGGGLLDPAHTKMKNILTAPLHSSH